MPEIRNGSSSCNHPNIAAPKCLRLPPGYGAPLHSRQNLSLPKIKVPLSLKGDTHENPCLLARLGSDHWRNSDRHDGAGAGTRCSP